MTVTVCMLSEAMQLALGQLECASHAKWQLRQDTLFHTWWLFLLIGVTGFLSVTMCMLSLAMRVAVGSSECPSHAKWQLGPDCIQTSEVKENREN